jgi:antagonist of KipI
MTAMTKTTPNANTDYNDYTDYSGYLEVIEPGAWSTIQDGGRYGYRAMGVPVCGAMDPLAAAIANKIAGNRQDAPLLEMMFSGPVLRYHGTDSLLAVIYGVNGELICGADRCETRTEHYVHVHQPLFSGRVFEWPDGAELYLGAFCDQSGGSGCRAYLAVAGGLSVVPVLGSASSDGRSGLGGHDGHGRALRAGDRIAVMAEATLAAGTRGGCGLRQDFAKSVSATVFTHDGPVPLHFLPGPEETLFDHEALDAFYGQVFTVSQRFDRMGFVMEGGPPIKAVRHDIISAPITFGTVQVPASGNPYLLLADAQTTGGYPRLAVLISADRPLAAQLWPGRRIQPIRCTLSEATQRLKALHTIIDNATWPPAELLIAPV